MTIKEANRLSAMRQIDKKMLSLRQASKDLGLSIRQTKRLRSRYLSEGESGLISRRRGRESANRIAQDVRDQVVEILRDSHCVKVGDQPLQKRS